MYLSDFEPSNGMLLNQKMMQHNYGHPRRYRMPVSKPLPKKRVIKFNDEKKSNASGDKDKSYPFVKGNKIFGMSAKTLATALVVMVIGVVVINLVGKKEGAAEAQPPIS